MSVPAERLPAGGSRRAQLAPASEPAARPARRPAARPTPASPPQPRARRGSTPAFWFLSAVVVSALVFAVVAVNALVVNTTYRISGVQTDVRTLEERNEELGIEVARLSSPSRVSEWADVVGMVVPEPGGSVILRVPGERRGTAG